MTSPAPGIVFAKILTQTLTQLIPPRTQPETDAQLARRAQTALNTFAAAITPDTHPTTAERARTGHDGGAHTP